MPNAEPQAEQARSARSPVFGGWRRLSVAVALSLLAGGIAAYWLVSQVLPYAVVGTFRGERERLYAGVTPASRGLRADTFRCEVEPGLVVKGWFLHAAGVPRGTVLLLHGHNSCKEAMLNLGGLFVGEGYNALLYDSRGHGESGGTFCTFGFYERRDCSRCLDELLKHHGALEVGPVAIYGNSLGGAVALQAMAADPRFRCGIVESTFATLREIVRDYEQQLSGVRMDGLTDAVVARAGALARFPPGAVRPEDAARQIVRPVLLIHGTADTNISYRYGERIFRNLAAPGSEWFPVPGANHGDLWRVGGEAYRARILGFVARWDH